MGTRRPKAVSEEERLQRRREQRKAAELKRKPGARRAYEARRQLRDPVYRMKKSMRATMYKRIRRKFSVIRASSQQMIGCNYDELRLHIQSLWKPGMTWENYGLKGWHVDHIVPLATAKTAEEIASLCRYTNLQPLWWWENLKKSYRMSHST